MSTFYHYLSKALFVISIFANFEFQNFLWTMINLLTLNNWTAFFFLNLKFPPHDYKIKIKVSYKILLHTVVKYWICIYIISQTFRHHNIYTHQLIRTIAFFQLSDATLLYWKNYFWSCNYSRNRKRSCYTIRNFNLVLQLKKMPTFSPIFAENWEIDRNQSPDTRDLRIWVANFVDLDTPY